MAHLDIIRPWKDEEHRLSLSEAEQAQLPAHPAGFIDLTGAQLQAVAGGSTLGYLGALIDYWLNDDPSKDHELADKAMMEDPNVCGEGVRDDGQAYWIICPD
jgi:mersacidin/lichenicidin family type 2 lantibiotic